MASRIASFVGTVQLRLKIEQATTTEDDPTPIYLMDEVAKVIGSNGKNIIDAVDIIQQRLHARSIVVKQKALRLVKHLAQRGSPQLKQALARHSSAVRDLTHFKCAPDPFKGDIPWKRVQEYAKEALDALHAAPQSLNNTTTATQSGPMLGNRIQGFGNDSSSSTSFNTITTANNRHNTMIGFGSDTINSSSRGPLERSPIPSTTATSSSSSVFDSFSSSMRGLTDRAIGSITRPEHRLMNSMGDDEFDGYHFPTASNNSNTTTSNNTTGNVIDATASYQQQQQQQQQHVSREQRIVDKICIPKGARIAPSSEDIKSFIDAVNQSDGIAVAACIQRKLERGSWQETLRALCGLEAILEKSTSASAGEVAVHFQSNPEVLRRARQSTQTTVRQRAERVLRLLGDETLPDVVASTSTTGGVHGGGDLLLGGDVMQSTVVDASQKERLSPSDLLAGLDIATTATTNTTTTTAPVMQQQQSNVDTLDALFGSTSATPPSTTNTMNTMNTTIVSPQDPFGDWSSASLPLQQPMTTTTTTTTNTMNNAPLTSIAQQSINNSSAIHNNNNNHNSNILDAFSDLSIQPQQQQQSMSGQHTNTFMMTTPTTTMNTTTNMMNSSNNTIDPFANFMDNNNTTATAATTITQPVSMQQPISMDALLGSVSSPTSNGNPQHQRKPSLGMNTTGQLDVLSALHAATSGISSAKREDAAFSFVSGTMEELKKK